MTLKPRWNRAARIAARDRPIDASNVSAQVPISAPSGIAIPAGSETIPAAANTMTTPMTADEDCITTVTAAPANIPYSGVSRRSNRSKRSGSLRRGDGSLANQKQAEQHEADSEDDIRPRIGPLILQPSAEQARGEDQRSIVRDSGSEELARSGGANVGPEDDRKSLGGA